MILRHRDLGMCACIHNEGRLSVSCISLFHFDWTAAECQFWLLQTDINPQRKRQKILFSLCSANLDLCRVVKNGWCEFAVLTWLKRLEFLSPCFIQLHFYPQTSPVLKSEMCPKQCIRILLVSAIHFLSPWCDPSRLIARLTGRKTSSICLSCVCIVVWYHPPRLTGH